MQNDDDAVNAAADVTGMKWKALGNAQFANRNFEDALECYSLAIAADDANHVFYGNRANVLSSMGEHERAVEDCERAIGLEPGYAKAYSRLGHALFHLGAFEEAVELGYRRAAELEPGSERAARDLADAEARLRRELAAAGHEGGEEAAGIDLGQLMAQLGAVFGGGAGGAQTQPGLLTGGAEGEGGGGGELAQLNGALGGDPGAASALLGGDVAAIASRLAAGVDPAALADSDAIRKLSEDPTFELGSNPMELLGQLGDPRVAAAMATVASAVFAGAGVGGAAVDQDGNELSPGAAQFAAALAGLGVGAAPPVVMQEHDADDEVEDDDDDDEMYR